MPPYIWSAGTPITTTRGVVYRHPSSGRRLRVHRTRYRYREPIRLGPHRLMLRPRESREVRLVSSALEISPAASVTWTNDVFGNAVASVTFAGPAEKLLIDSTSGVELGAAPWPIFDIAGSALR